MKRTPDLGFATLRPIASKTTALESNPRTTVGSDFLLAACGCVTSARAAPPESLTTEMVELPWFATYILFWIGLYARSTG
jgi:hypothetical protein